MKRFTLAIIGAGSRGKDSYSPILAGQPERFHVVAVAEPIPERRHAVADLFHIPDEMCFYDDQAFFAMPKLADGVLICTQDAQHYSMACRALELGYKVMLEKPISPSEEECEDLLRRARAAHTDILICHVLRYTPFFQTIKNVLDSGKLGTLIHVNYQENIGYWHFAHSYVRGNWRRSDESSPMILAKCCHDMDMLQYLLNSKLISVSASGSLRHFRKENAPENAPLRCTDGCPCADTCAFNAEKVYLGELTDWPVNTISEDLSPEGRMKALREGRYGRCVYHCDNNVADHYLALMQFENGTEVTFTASAFSNVNERTMRFMGSKGELFAEMGSNHVELLTFRGGIETAEHTILQIPETSAGHSGGDAGIIDKWYDMLLKAPSEPVDFEAAVHSHRMAFSLEKARISGSIVKPE